MTTTKKLARASSNSLNISGSGLTEINDIELLKNIGPIIPSEQKNKPFNKNNNKKQKSDPRKSGGGSDDEDEEEKDERLDYESEQEDEAEDPDDIKSAKSRLAKAEEEKLDMSDTEEDTDVDDDISVYGDDDDEPTPDTLNKTLATAQEKNTIPGQHSAMYQLNEDDDNDDDDDDDDESDKHNETYLQKFNNDIRDNFILNYHPEAKNHNYEEVRALSRVVRDEKTNIITDSLHKTLPFLTKYEKTRVLGQRARQINAGSLPLVKIFGITDGYIIANMELEQKKLPFIIKRPIPSGGCEYWNISDLELI
jgi:DNA-directed RNA polymerase subunit K/omega